MFSNPWIDEFVAWCDMHLITISRKTLDIWCDEEFIPMSADNIIRERFLRNIPCNNMEYTHETKPEISIPEDDDDMAYDPKNPRKRKAKGKPAAATLLKSINPNVQKGKVIAFIMKGCLSVEKICDEFFPMERHDLLTILNICARTYGIGYSVDGDALTLTLPKGVVDPFEMDL